MSKHKFFQLIKPDVNFEIVGLRNSFLTLSGVAVLVSLLAIAIFGLNFGIDFSGGTEIQVLFSEKVELKRLTQGQVTKDLEKAFKGSKSEAQRFGREQRSFLFKFGEISVLSKEQENALRKKVQSSFTTFKGFRLRSEGGNKVDVTLSQKLSDGKDKKDSKQGNELQKLASVFEKEGLKKVVVDTPVNQSSTSFEYTVSFAGLSDKIGEKLDAMYGAGNVKILRVESVGPRVGDQLKNQGILAILLANLFILIYIAIRFDFRYAPGAVAALIHDVLITTGIFSILQIPFDLSIVAALLTIVGYSLNDTIVVYDRIRENAQKSKSSMDIIMNRSINETLSRTLLTSFTTFLAVTPIFLIGGENIRWFAFAMMFGILIGTYSSLAIASPIVFLLDQFFKRNEEAEAVEQEEKRLQRKRKKAGLTT